MTISQAREILGTLVQHLTDTEIEQLITESKRWANTVLDFLESSKT